MVNAQEKLDQLTAKITQIKQTQPNLASKKTQIIAVSKTMAREHIIPFIQAGMTDFGENRVQEAKEKWPSLKAEYPKCRLHLLGSLQSNKIKDALQLFDVIHSIDRPKLLPILAQELPKIKQNIQLFLQINISQEPQKSGISLHDADEFIIQACQTYQLPVIGLMGIAKADQHSAPYFALLHQLAQKHKLPGLSMGMSHDYETAIQFGATHIRIGTYLFGNR